MKRSMLASAVVMALLTACGGSDDSPDSSEPTEADDAADDAGGAGGEFSDTEPFASVSAMANLPHGVGPMGVAGECSRFGGSYRFSSSGDDRFQFVIFAGSPPTVESATAFVGDRMFTFVEIDTVEVDNDRYFISGVGAESGREGEADPMSFLVVCNA